MNPGMVETAQVNQKLSRDFWIFWIGQTISNIGSAFTTFVLPLLIFKITNSALSLALGLGVTFLPYALFGLVIGAWVDRANRKRLMIAVDLVRAALIAGMAILASMHLLPMWLMYVVMFAASTLAIAFNAAQLAAIPSLVDRDNLMKANGRVQASFSASLVIGPLLAGLLIAIMPAFLLLYIDALSFIVSVLSLQVIKASFNTHVRRAPTTLRQDVGEGLRYVFGHPVLRTVSVMSGLLVFLSSTANAQVVLLVKQQFHASDTRVGLFYTAGGIGFVIFSLMAGRLRTYWSFSGVVLGSAMLKGIALAVLGLTQWYALGLVMWLFSEGLGMLYAINTTTLRQTIVPGQLLGRVASIAQVMAWSCIPVGTFIGGLVIESTQKVGLVYTGIGVLHVLIPVAFLFTSLGHVEHYLSRVETAEKLEQAAALS